MTFRHAGQMKPTITPNPLLNEPQLCELARDIHILRGGSLESFLEEGHAELLELRVRDEKYAAVIDDLEKRLAESESNLEESQDLADALKRQLAERDKTITTLFESHARLAELATAVELED